MIRLLVKVVPLIVLIYAFREGTASATELLSSLTSFVGRGLAHVEVGQIARALESDYASTGRFPRDFGAFIEESLSKPGTDARLDRWGMPYELRIQGHHYEVVSSGPDRTPFTADDVIVSGEGSHSLR
jgi:hypothetical protein